MHWAHTLIGKPWRPDALGPDAFGCWGLVSWVFENVHGIKLPNVTGSDGAASLLAAAHDSGWRPLAKGTEPEVDDVIVFNSVLGPHVGIVIRANNHLGVLHSDGRLVNGKPTGCVVFESFPQLIRTGYHRFELWRHQP